MNLPIRTALILLLCPVLPLMGQAGTQSAKKQSSADSLSQYEIEEVTVYGRRLETRIIPAQILSGKELKRLGVLSAADAIRYFSGVQIKDYGGIGGLKTVNIRSMGTQHVGVFYDGIQLGNAQNGQIDLGRFSLDNMDAVSLYNGQKSAIFQSAKDFASSSSVYLTTRVPGFEEAKKTNLGFTFKTGSFGLANPSLLWEQKLSKRVSSSVSAEYLYTTGRYKFKTAAAGGYDTTEVRHNGDVSALRAEAGLFGKLTGGEWKAKVYLYDSERGYPGASVRGEPGVFLNEDRQWDRNLFVQSSFRKKIASFYSLMLNGKFAYDYLRYLCDPDLNESKMYVDNTYRQREAYLSVVNGFTLTPWWSANLSADFQWNKLDADMTDFVYPTRRTLLTAAATSMEFNSFRMQASLLHTYVHDSTRVRDAAAPGRSVFTPAVMASWQPWKATDLNLRAFYKRIFRMPTFNDLYYTFIGNATLDPEYTTQYDVGVTYSRNFSGGALARFEVQVDGYYNQVKDKIVAMPTSNQFRWTMVNLGYVEIRGVDAAVQGAWRIGAVRLDTRLTYTYQKAQDLTEGAPGQDNPWYGGQIPYVPWHSGSVILGAAWRSWDLNYSYIHTGERYTARANIPENHMQPWYTHDMSLSKGFQWKRTALRLSAEVNNLFNQPYEVVDRYPMPGTNFRIRLNITL